jgi:hypothetical protein
MKTVVAVISLLLLAASSSSHSKYQRPVQGLDAGQNYAVVDETIWKHARADLGDLRLEVGGAEIPYSLITVRRTFQQERKDLPVLQQSIVGGKTRFLIDMSGLVEYDHVELRIGTRNFVAYARVEGQDDPHGPVWALLGNSILYDLSADNLGSNSMLRIPRATYKYLRVTIDGAVEPRDVRGATSQMAEQQPAAWRDVNTSPQREQQGRDTVFTFSVDEKTPVERIVFSLDAAQGNFRRSVEVTNEKNVGLGGGEIDRIHLVRSGQKIDSERQQVEFSGTGQKTIKIKIHNGDDQPLKVADARLQQLERRIYFDRPAGGSVILYYGDEKLDPPIYDYAKLFQQEKTAKPAQLGGESLNPAFSERPDERPWSERHPLVLWIAIVAAVLGLGAIALRSMRTVPA